MKLYTREEISDAYSSLIWVQGLVDFVVHAGFDLTGNKAETEGSLVSIFSIIQRDLKAAESIMDDLDNGYEERFTSVWRKQEEAKQ